MILMSITLSSGKSYSQHERDRLAAGFTSTEESAAAQKKNQNVKNKKHHGPFQSYNINQEALENELENMPSNRPINWTRLAKKNKCCNKKRKHNSIKWWSGLETVCKFKRHKS